MIFAPYLLDQADVLNILSIYYHRNYYKMVLDYIFDQLFTIGLIVTLFTLLYLYLTRKHDYWVKQGVPGPKPLPFFGTYCGQFVTPFQESEVERYRKYGKIYGIFDGTEPGLIVGDPTLIKDIMVGQTALDTFPNRRGVKTTHKVMSLFLSSLEDADWKRVRSITTPTFSSGKLRSIIPIMEEAAGPMLETLQKAALSMEAIELKKLFGDYTMAVICESAFATSPTDKFVYMATQLFTFPFWRKFLDYTMPKEPLDKADFTVLPKGPMNFFQRVTLEIIRYRREHNIKIKDFLQLLMDAEAPNIENANDENAEATDASTSSRKTLSEDEIIAQSVLFFSVGFETSSQLLTYAAYCLALNPQVQEKAYNEIMEADGAGLDTSTYSLSNLPYLDAVIKETLRLYNPVLRMERRANKDFALGETGIIVKKEMIVGIPVWALHHCEEYFPEPFKFIPERFLPENKDNIIEFTYLPFGEGPRNCIGSRFALLECHLALLKVLRSFKFVPHAKTKVPLEFVTTGRPLLGPKPIYVGIERR